MCNECTCTEKIGCKAEMLMIYKDETKIKAYIPALQCLKCTELFFDHESLVKFDYFNGSPVVKRTVLNVSY